MNKFILTLAFLFSFNTFSQNVVTEWDEDEFFVDEISSEVQSEEKGIRSVLFLINPAKISFVAEYTPENLINLIDEYRTRALAGEFVNLGINTGYIEMDVKNDKAKLTFFSSRFGVLEKAMKMKISPKGDNQLKIQAKIPYCHMKELYKASSENDDRWGFSKKTENVLKEVLAI